jgi:hypothetical protein
LDISENRADWFTIRGSIDGGSTKTTGHGLPPAGQPMYHSRR